MQTKMYTIYDKVAQEAGPTFHAKNDGIALRSFNDAIKNSPYPEDFQLFCLGTFEPEKMVIVVNDAPLLIEVDYESLQITEVTQ